MRTRSFSYYILAADLCCIPAAMLAAFTLHNGISWSLSLLDNLQSLLPLMLAAGILWAVCFCAMELDGAHDGWWFPAVASRVFLAAAAILLGLVAVQMFVHGHVSHLALANFSLNFFLGCLTIRYAVRGLIRIRYRRGKVRRVAIVGGDRVAREVAAKIARHPEMLWQVVGYFVLEDIVVSNGSGNAASDLNKTSSIPAPPNLTTLSTLEMLDSLRVERVEELVVTVGGALRGEFLDLLARCRKSGIHVSLVPQPYELYLSRPRIRDLDGVPLLELNESAGGGTLRWKRALDLLLSSALLVLTLPVLLPCGLWLFWRKGQVFMRQPRCGRLGRPFLMLRLNIERQHGEPTKGHSSWFDRLLENLSLTELPQLWNVLRGEMSVVGPRPDTPERVTHYSEWQAQRLSIAPGIVGLAQVHGLREHSSSEEKARFDLQYLLHLSPLTDLALLLQTSWTLGMRLMRSPAAHSSDTRSAGRNRYVGDRRDQVQNEPAEGAV